MIRFLLYLYEHMYFVVQNNFVKLFFFYYRRHEEAPTYKLRCQKSCQQLKSIKTNFIYTGPYAATGSHYDYYYDQLYGNKHPQPSFSNDAYSYSNGVF